MLRRMSEIADEDFAPQPMYSETGVDISLIEWMLSLTPLERLQFLERRIEDIRLIRKLNGRE